MTDTHSVVNGAGQAGLSISHELTERGIGHVVLERGRAGEAWRRRWDHFCLVTPNWAIDLPGFGYDGDDPDGFMPRDDLVAMLERYAASFDAPVHTNVSVDSVAGAGRPPQPDQGNGTQQQPEGRTNSEVAATHGGVSRTITANRGLHWRPLDDAGGSYRTRRG